MRIVLLFLMSIIALTTKAETVEMADKMRENGKIYVVVAVLLVIMLGLIIYLVSIDRKVSRLEKETKKNQ